jgi:cystathionine beta-lyase/cystathionine gamma-synthase
MIVIGLPKLHVLATKRPALAPALRALAARLSHLERNGAEALAASLGGAADGDEVHLKLAEHHMHIVLRYDAYAGVLLIVNAKATGVTI